MKKLLYILPINMFITFKLCK